MKRSAFIILILSLPLLTSSCSNELDFEESWIELYTHHDYAHSNREEVTGDTIYTGFTTIDEPLILQVATQSNNGSSPRFFMQIDDGERIEITKEVPMGGSYIHDNGATREIRDIEIMIPSNLFSEGQVITYETRIGSHSGLLAREVYVIIED